MESKDLEVKLGVIETELTKFFAKHAEEVKVSGTASTETKTALDSLGTQHKETAARLLVIEQAITAKGTADASTETKSIGQMVVESEEFKALGNRNSTGKIKVGNMHKATMINATG